MEENDLRAERGAFFGSIFGPLNHILWGDTMWMSRWCSDVARPDVTIADSPAFRETPGAWEADRFRMDGRIRIWAQTLSNIDLCSQISWHSGALGRDVTRPISVCVVHMFNHQTHHRGQVSQMLNAAGISPTVSDLFALPPEA
jgi:uncharacterized damage-inducible protein DinB